MDTTDAQKPPDRGANDASGAARATRHLNVVARNGERTPTDLPQSRADREIERLAIALGVLRPVPYYRARPMAAGARKGRTAR
jgi:hypothetical protein